MKKQPLKKFKKTPQQKEKATKKLQPKKQAIKESKSPRNSRFIPDAPLRTLASIVWNKYFIVSFISTFISVAIVMQGINLTGHIAQLQTIRNERSELRQEIGYWEQIVAKHPDYRDGYFKLALLEYQLGEKDKARQYVERTLTIDPNYQPAITFQKKMMEKE